MTTNPNPEWGECPSGEALAAYLAGKPPFETLERVARHLETCGTCLSQLDALAGLPDPLVAGLRRPVETQFSQEPECSQAVALVMALPGRSPPSPPTVGESEETRNYHPAPLGQLGQYELLDKVGEGGMGQVYKARHRLMNQTVAVKLIHKKYLDHPASLERFRREIQALARLDHPNIVRAQYADQVDDTHFLVMEYVAGRSLSELVKEQGPLPVARACDYIRQAAQALQNAHEHGLVHRDIKPSNLLVTPAGQVKVLDLGLALVREEKAAAELTEAGQLLGTYDYMAPEQWDDTHAVDIRADLYSLGCTLYCLLAGRPPFSGPEYASASRKMKAHATSPVPPIRQVRPEVPEALAAVLERLLAKDPAGRFATPDEVGRALEPFSHGGETSAGVSPEASTGYSTFPGSGKAGPRWPVLLGAGLAAACLILVLLLTQPFGSSSPESPSPDTPKELAKEAQPRANPLRILSFQVKHFRGDPPVLLGAMGDPSLEALEKDIVRIEARFSGPAYCYLIAFNPDGKEQLLSPEEETAKPKRLTALTYPAEVLGYWRLTDGPGLQAFVVVASRQPLSSYRHWQSRVGIAPWEKLPQRRAWGVWQYDGDKTVLRDVPVRGQVRLYGMHRVAVGTLCQSPATGLAGVPWPACYWATRDGPMQRLHDLGKFLTNCVGVEAVQGVAFPVRPEE
jgi:serine/threonine protein kinase